MNEAHVHGDTGDEIDTAAVNEGIRYTMFSVFSVTETLPADEAERKAVVAEAESLHAQVSEQATGHRRQGAATWWSAQDVTVGPVAPPVRWDADGTSSAPDPDLPALTAAAEISGPGAPDVRPTFGVRHRRPLVALWLLAVLAGKSSLVHCTNLDPAKREARRDTERTTVELGD